MTTHEIIACVFFKTTNRTKPKLSLLVIENKRNQGGNKNILNSLVTISKLLLFLFFYIQE